MEAPKFIADVHLGKLARMLRMLGFDTLYRNDFTKGELSRHAAEEGRILLSRDAALIAAGGSMALLIRHKDPEQQLRQVAQAFRLYGLMVPFPAASGVTDCSGR